METKKYLKKIVLPFLIAVISTVFVTVNSYAANGTISVVPANGTFQKGEVFTASVNIEGGGTAFNAAKAKVAVSQNLTVEGLVLGDCDFALVQTPSIGSLGFAGVILGGSKDRCTIYTLTLKANSGSTGFIFLSEASIKSFRGAAEILSSVNNSSYTFESGSAGNQSNSIAAAPSPTQSPLSLANGVKLYTLVYNVTTPGKTLSEGLKVVLDQGRPNEMLSTPQANSSNRSVLSAIFENVPEGVHTIAVLDNEKSISKQIVNIAGQNREITLGVTPESAGAGSLLWLITLAIIMIVIVTVGVLTYIVVWRKNHPGST